jgi:hypothetical protein
LISMTNVPNDSVTAALASGLHMTCVRQTRQTQANLIFDTFMSFSSLL